MTPTFAGEMQLAGWSESHTGGCKVTFWLSSTDELAAFRALTVRKGNTAGHRFMAALVEIGDDEKPVQPDMGIPIAEKEPIGDCCKRAVMWCKDPQFWRWIESTTHNGISWPVVSESDAREFVCEICNVESRRELDTLSQANKTWHREIREPYRLWLQKQPMEVAA